MAGPEITDVESCFCNNTTVARRALPEKDNRQQPVAFFTTFSSLLFRRGLLLGRHGGNDRSAFSSLTACNPSDWDKQREKEGTEEQLARGKEREEGDEEKEEQEEEEDFVILITSDESLVFHSTSLVFSSSVCASQQWHGGRTSGIRSFLLLLFSRRSCFITRHKGGGTAAAVSEGRLSFSTACVPVCRVRF